MASNNEKYPNYLDLNRKAWDDKTAYHFESEFYDVEGFLNGRSSLNDIELKLLGDIRDQSILHLQCHFGMDTISLAKLGGQATGVDFSEEAIQKARRLTLLMDVPATFVVSDVYSLALNTEQLFDIVFTSYGTIGWLPDLDQWAEVVSKHLKPGGKFVFVEFHPLIWMYDDDFTKITYSYFKSEPIHELFEGTYAQPDAPLTQETVSWNHSISEVVNALIRNGLHINSLDEYNYSPYPCFRKIAEIEKGKFIIEPFGDKIPMVYSIVAEKRN